MWQDISRPTEVGMETYPGDPAFDCTRVREVEKDGYQLTEIRMSAHCGTHMDAPAHFIAGGKTIDQLDSSLFFGPALCIAARTPADLRRTPAGTRRVIVRDEGFGGLRMDDAEYLLAAGVRLFGTDRLSVSADDVTMAVHVKLLGAEMLLLEGLNFAGLPEGEYELTALPIRLTGSDGAPARAFVRPLQK